MSAVKPVSNNERMLAIDMAKGFAIILVVFGHALRGLVKAGALPPNIAVLSLDYVIYTFHMPLFFALSGIFFNRTKLIEKRAFWWSRIRSIVYPYFFWSLIHGGLQSAFAGSGATNSSMPASRLLEIAWSPIIPYWFLYALFFCYVLAVATRRLPIWIVGVISFSLFVASFFIPTSVLGDIAYGFFYFTVGMIARKIDLLVWIPFSLRNIAIASVAFLTTALISYAIGVPERLPVISAVAGIVVVLMISLRLECSLTLSRATWLLILIGQCSMGIYVMHIIVLALGRTFLLRIFQISEPVVLLASITVLGVAIPLLVQVAAIRLNVGDILALPRSGRLIGRNKRFVLKWGSETTGASASATSSSSNE